MAEHTASFLVQSGFPVRHAGSFGFDFVAIDNYFDSVTDDSVLRLAFADLPLPLFAHLAEAIPTWWAGRERVRAA